MESLSGKAEVIYGIGNNFAWAFGYALLPVLAYFIREWRKLQVTISAPLVINILFAFFFPESPRWLLAKGRVEEAEKVVKKIRKVNKLPNLDENFLHPIENVEENGWKIFRDLFRKPYLTRATLILYYIFFAKSVTYLGLSLSYGTLIPDGSLYLDIFISALTEFPAYGLATLVVFFTGRRLTLIGSYFIGKTSGNQFPDLLTVNCPSCM